MVSYNERCDTCTRLLEWIGVNASLHTPTNPSQVERGQVSAAADHSSTCYDFGGCRSLYRLPCGVDHAAGVDRIRYGCALTPYEVPTLPRLMATHVLPNPPPLVALQFPCV